MLKRFFFCGVAAIVAVGCTDKSATGPSSPCPQLAAGDRPLAEIGGAGCGSVHVAPYLNGGSFAATITVRVALGKPVTTYTLQRAPEVGRANGADGVCQRALSLAPWSSSDPPAPSFVTFPLPNTDPTVTLTTDASGRGEKSFDFKAAGIATPIQFDVMFRALDNLTAPTTILQSTCFTVSAP